MPTLTTEALYKILLDNMGPQHWWPAKSPEEMMLGAILSTKYKLEERRYGFNAFKRKHNLMHKNFIVTIS